MALFSLQTHSPHFSWTPLWIGNSASFLCPSPQLLRLGEFGRKWKDSKEISKKLYCGHEFGFLPSLQIPVNTMFFFWPLSQGRSLDVTFPLGIFSLQRQPIHSPFPSEEKILMSIGGKAFFWLCSDALEYLKGILADQRSMIQIRIILIGQYLQRK